MKVIHLSYADTIGGAARAAYRIHQAIYAADIDSEMWVNSKHSQDWRIIGPNGKLDRAWKKIKPAIASHALKSIFRTENSVTHSPAIFKSDHINEINKSDADLIHLHWVQGEMLSISDIGKIRKPVVWTMHDMWPICGAEHYAEDYRWRDGYKTLNRPIYEQGFDINRKIWLKKLREWRREIQIVTPSRWLERCVRESALMSKWPVTFIPNPINTDRWIPIEKSIARKILGLPMESRILLFGAVGGGSDPRKGFDLLIAALKVLRTQSIKLDLVVFGESAPKIRLDLGFPIHYVGKLYDEASLRLVYSAANLFALPSRQDNLPNTGLEALACGTPVVGFSIGGMPDIVENLKNGYLAKENDYADLANGIKWSLEENNELNLSRNSREFVLRNFNYPYIAKRYRDVYEKVLAKYSIK